jgi:hypothetical protein
MVLVLGCTKPCPEEKVCPTVIEKMCPTVGTTTLVTATTVATTVTSSAPKAVGRATPLSNRGVSRVDAQKAIAEQENPILVVATVSPKEGKSGVELAFDNTTGKTASAFKGYIYGYNKIDECDEIALGGKFVEFTSADGTTVPPGKSTQWYSSFYKLGAGVTAVVEIVKIKFEDGSEWAR